MSRSLAVIFVTLAVSSQCFARGAKIRLPTCDGNADPFNNCKTVSCLPATSGGSFVRQPGAFTAPKSGVSGECLWILRAPNEQTITKLQLKSAAIAPGDILQFQDGADIIALTAGQSVDAINQQLNSFVNRKLPVLLVSFKNAKNDKTADSHFDLDYQFA